MSLFGFAVQTRISKSDDDGKDNLSSTTNSYDDVFAIGENVTSFVQSQVSLQKGRGSNQDGKKGARKSKKKKEINRLHEKSGRSKIH